jgi:hypothetical protein
MTTTPTWLTTVLRPAGELDPGAERRLVDALEAAAAASDVVVVDVGAAGPLSGNLRRALRRVHAGLTSTGGALVLLDPGARTVSRCRTANSATPSTCRRSRS